MKWPFWTFNLFVGFFVASSAVACIDRNSIDVNSHGSSTGTSGSGSLSQEATFKLAPGTMPSPQIVVQTQDFWLFSVYEYMVDANGAKPIVTSACVAQDDPNGDMADVDALMLGSFQGGEYVPLSSAMITGNTACFTFATEQISFDPGSTGNLNLAAHVAVPISLAAAGGAWHGVPRSGHSPRFRLVSVTTKGGQQIVLPNHPTPPMVLRKSRPIIKQLPLSSAALADGDRDLIKWQVGADSAGSIAQNHYEFYFDKTAGFAVDNLRLRRNASDIPMSEYMIGVASTSNFNGLNPGIVSSDMGAWIYFTFTDEETIQGSGNVYTLHGVVNGATQGDAITLGIGSSQFSNGLSGDSEFYGLSFTGTLICANFDGTAILLNGATMINQNTVRFGSLLWRDFSEQSYTVTSCLTTNSTDWINEIYVPGIAISQTLKF